MHQTLLESCSQLENMLEPAGRKLPTAGRQAGRDAASNKNAPDLETKDEQKKRKGQTSRYEHGQQRV
jgi:hypothetical protein